MKITILSQMQRGLYIFLCLTGVFGATAQTTNTALKFDEVYQLLHEHVVGLTGEELDQAAVRGLLSELRGRASLATNLVAENTPTNLISKTAIHDKAFAYFRFHQVGAKAGPEFTQQYAQWAETNKIKGIILDLRFAGGEDYAAAAALADQFLPAEQPLLDWGQGLTTSTAKNTLITVPVAVLVNRDTRGAAEALAAVLHEMKAGLLLGSTTAGQASIFQEFPLRNGQKLRIAVSPVKVGQGKALTPAGLEPDIEIAVGREEEKSYFEDPYKMMAKSIQTSSDTNVVVSSGTETNQTRGRLNEAELVRRHRQGLTTDEEFTDKPAGGAGNELRLINDPVLNRALDLLKGLAVVQQTRPL